MKASKFPSLALALLLQFAPVLKLAQPGPLLATSPFAMILKWAVAAVAVAGAFHTVSGASAKLASPSTAKGTNGVNLTYKVVITDGTVRTPGAWDVTGLPPGLAGPNQNNIISGKPTVTGAFSTRITAWEHSNRKGSSLTFTLAFTIVDNPSLAPPAITAQPASQTVPLGGAATFSVTATGAAPLTYQWNHDNQPVTTGTGSTFTISPVSASDAGNYTVTVSNAAGRVTSAAAALNVTIPPPVITGQPASLTMHEKEGVVFEVVATGSGPIAYQWSKGGTELPGEIAARLVLDSVTPADAGNYTVRVTGPGGSVTSALATLTVVDRPRLAQPGLSGNVLKLVFNSIPGHAYVVESNPTPESSGWVVESTLPGATATTATVEINLGLETRFFRVRTAN